MPSTLTIPTSELYMTVHDNVAVAVKVSEIWAFEKFSFKCVSISQKYVRVVQSYSDTMPWTY